MTEPSRVSAAIERFGGDVAMQDQAYDLADKCEKLLDRYCERLEPSATGSASCDAAERQWA